MMKWNWDVVGAIAIGIVFVLLLFALPARGADELPFKTYEWTDGHGRVCTATLHEYLDPEDVGWVDIINCMQFIDGVATPCKPTYITRVDTLDCDWPSKGWGTSYPARSIEDPLIQELLK